MNAPASRTGNISGRFVSFLPSRLEFWPLGGPAGASFDAESVARLAQRQEKRPESPGHHSKKMAIWESRFKGLVGGAPPMRIELQNGERSGSVVISSTSADKEH